MLIYLRIDRGIQERIQDSQERGFLFGSGTDPTLPSGERIWVVAYESPPFCLLPPTTLPVWQCTGGGQYQQRERTEQGGKVIGIIVITVFVNQA